MTAEPWTPEEIGEAERVNAMREERPDFAACRAIATIRALQRQYSDMKQVCHLQQTQIRELKTPSGYWDDDGDPLCYDDGADGAPVESFEELERWATQCLFDDGERIKVSPHKAMPEVTYIVRWTPDPDDPDMRRVKLERVEE